jgi:hypothetical protein
MDHATIGTKRSVPEKQRLVDKFVKSVFEDNGLLQLLVLTVMVRGLPKRALEESGILNNIARTTNFLLFFFVWRAYVMVGPPGFTTERAIFSGPRNKPEKSALSTQEGLPSNGWAQE